MAKKKQTNVEVEEPQVQEKTAVKTAMVVKQPKAKDTWEIKDRQYYLLHELSPISYMLRASDIYYFDEKKGYERELKYTRNQKTPFVDEFPKNSDARLEHIIFRNGVLQVPKEKTVLQKLLSLYHPGLNKRYSEKDYQQEAENQLDWLEFEVQALNAAQTLDIDHAEAVLRVEYGSKVSEMSSKEIKRDSLLFARNNPRLFLELVTDDNVQLRNFGIKAVEAHIIELSQDQRHFVWSSNQRKLMTIPYEEHPYSALAAWFKTDEGMEVYKSIEKRLM
jgi:hypothetical protein